MALLRATPHIFNDCCAAVKSWGYKQRFSSSVERDAGCGRFWGGSQWQADAVPDHF
jgi:hypothetical protein